LLIETGPGVASSRRLIGTGLVFLTELCRLFVCRRRSGAGRRRSYRSVEVRSPWKFQAVLDRARQRQRIALAIFERGNGPALLGIPAAQAT
jgi:hypothetical protein